MFLSEHWDKYDKHLLIYDNASDIRLELDTDDVNPDDVTPATVDRIVKALNQEFYPDAR